ncbi:MAG TPA: beta-galactosidase trimerization domain-containing protein [Candidatus Hydrogenedentes bacterium]|nr:beta-galactosidase trimerization domain-containing protein [Candidatus Hydrogenedentota bacterium]
MKRILWLLALGLACVWSAHAKKAEAPLNKITLEVPSPHVAWARPLQGGPIRVLFIAPRRTLRDAAELAQRIDLAFKTAAVEDLATPEKGLAIEQILEEPFDAIVIGNADLAKLPETLQSRLIELVTRGAGLVLAQYQVSGPSPFQDFLTRLAAKEDPGIVTRGVGEWMASSGEGARRNVLVAEHEKGRVVLLEYPGDPAYAHFLVPAPIDPMAAFPAYLENAMALAARAVRWAAHREGTLWISSVADIAPQGPPDEEIPPGYPREFVQMMRDPSLRQPMRPYRIQLNQPADRDYSVSVQLRQPDTTVQLAYTCDVPLKKGMDSYPVDLLVGPGEYMADFWITGKKGVVDWFTGTVKVQGWPELTKVEYAKDFLFRNDTLDITATVRANLRTEKACTIYARATDPIGSASTPGGRLTAEAKTRLTKEGGTAVLRLGFADLLAPMVKIEVFAIEGEKPVFSSWELNCSSRDFRYLTVRRATQPSGLHLLVRTRHAEEYNERFFLGWLHHLGVDAALVPGTESDVFYSASLGLNALPELDPLQTVSAAPDACLLDPGVRASIRKSLGETAARYWAGGSGQYLLQAPSPDIEAYRKSAVYQEGFAAWLKEQYGHIAALESAWGASCSAWESAVPLSAGDAAASNRYAPYMDFACYLDKTASDFIAFVRESIRAVDTEASVGMMVKESAGTHGAPAVSSATDFLVIDHNDPRINSLLHTPRLPNQFSAVSFYPQNTDITVEAHWRPWNALLHQVPGLWCISNDVGDTVDLLAPDGRLTPYMRELMNTMSELKQGIGPLLLAATPEPPRIVLLDSRASRRLNEVYRYAGVAYGQNLALFARIMDQLHFPYDILEAPASAVNAQKYRVLILPLACALSDAEVAAIRQFIQRGGTVIADVVPGIFDEHGTPRGMPPLEALLGIRYHGLGNMIHAPGEVTVEDEKYTLDAVDADGGVEAAEATPAGQAGEAPLWLSREEKGMAVLLNQRIAGMESEPALKAFFLSVLERAGCEPLPAPTHKGKNGFQGNIFHYRYGAAELYALLTHEDSPGQRLRMPFEKKDRVYDLRRGKKVRKPHSAAYRLAGGDACVFAKLPYEVSGLTVAAPAGIAAGRRLPVHINIQTRRELPGDHLICLDLMPDKGEPLMHYRQYVHCAKGVGETFIPLALNEIPGRYLLHARDILTGTEKIARVGISGPVR